MPSAFDWPVRVYYEDTDAGGIVFYANYLKFFERARTEWLRATGVQQQALLDAEGTAFVVKSASLDYHAPARLDDELTIRTSVEKLGRASVQFAQQAWRGDTLLTSASVKVGCVDLATMRPRSLPGDVADKMRGA
ncbi:tol-pal system-associated acyl-CoA thioesterase [Massilia sp. ST3]|uniref:tol-pal system-associated acyl-CoA thioesterase n=1 Tax=Massilia sp. ST3 TaxID=2824903 RepID=UPI001B81C157|nr:tol-pal system-associated acyl-CoA thioesterase [Massilia sp. ST3]MBQ5948739.1 tol-pal system-associated acyl-CoA thioesterase [Massilia sp. ST3]